MHSQQSPFLFGNFSWPPQVSESQLSFFNSCHVLTGALHIAQSVTDMVWLLRWGQLSPERLLFAALVLHAGETSMLCMVFGSHGFLPRLTSHKDITAAGFQCGCLLSCLFKIILNFAVCFCYQAHDRSGASGEHKRTISLTCLKNRQQKKRKLSGESTLLCSASGPACCCDTKSSNFLIYLTVSARDIEFEPALTIIASLSCCSSLGSIRTLETISKSNSSG